MQEASCLAHFARKAAGTVLPSDQRAVVLFRPTCWC